MSKLDNENQDDKIDTPEQRLENIDNFFNNLTLEEFNAVMERAIVGRITKGE